MQRPWLRKAQTLYHDAASRNLNELSYLIVSRRNGRKTNYECKPYGMSALGAVIEFGEENWRKVAILVSGRTRKQCRERWVAQLSPVLVRDDWTP
jgi:hypothetical protein